MNKRLLIVMLLVLLSGCWDSDEIEDMYYIHSIGLDFQDNQYEIYAQVFNFQALPSAGGEQGGEGLQAIVGKGQGETIVDAVHDLYPAAQRRIFWGHLSSVVFTEEALNNDIEGAIDVLSRFYEIRPNLWMFATDEPLEELLNTFPIMNLNVIFSYFGEPKESHGQSSYISPIIYNEFNANRNEPGRTVLLPVIGIEDDRWIDEGGYKSNLSVNAVSLVQGKQYYGILKDEEMLGVRWIQEETRRSPIVVYNDDLEPSGLAVFRVKDVKIIPNQNEDPVTFDIEIEVQGRLIEMLNDITEEQIVASAEKTIKEDVRKTFEQALDFEADVYSLSYELFRQDHQKWKELGEDIELGEDTLQEIKIDVNLMDSGVERIP
ncbi:Ger(x)C family germination protein [Alkalibacillus filiformis]|uniref:Ger(X)C family germination protein n=1 Tax=Alkalibacillus filiformis TaxID=200990 RepID=A0ABU0DP81_9BACI|nr:Ger(x)C family spore germination protein [Alkalibacillus filiformis]MDQ0350268.1 Ger(x)C family germination protein [Alkalibacillus filiformis]